MKLANIFSVSFNLAGTTVSQNKFVLIIVAKLALQQIIKF